jgi:serine/threonine protein kinase/Tfp pilus assembly protein PilF
LNKELAANTTLSHYRIVSKLGEGGMGEVYLAEDTRLRRRVALKILPDKIAADPSRLLRFEREAFAASALNHPNILTIFEFGAVDNKHFLASELVEGVSLRQRLTSGPVPLNETLDIAIQTASALQAAHEAGIIHRDIKPDNLMLRADGYVKVLDFGLAKLMEGRGDRSTRGHGGEGDTLIAESPRRDVAASLTSPGLIMGTVGYMSPEQTRGLNVDKRADIWSLGCVLYEMLSGESPFRGDTMADTLANIIHREPVSILTRRRDANPELERIVNRSLAKNAAERYQSAEEFLTDLKQLLKRREFEAQVERSSTASVETARTQIINSPTAGLEGSSSPNEITRATATESNANRATAPTTMFPASPSANSLSEPGKSRSRRTTIIIAAMVVTVVAVGAALLFNSYRSRSSGGAIQSIAVMPFVNASGNADVEYLSDGLTDSLIFRFSQLPNVKVSPTSSVMRFKNTTKDVTDIARELNVDAVLTGRLMRAGDDLSVSVQLIDARTQKLIWAEQYDRKMADLMATQREIATTLTQKMQLRLAGDERGITKKYTSSNDAYQLYLKGRYHWSRRTKDDLDKAIDSYKKAIELDPNFALAYAATAEVYNSMGKNPDVPPRDCIPLAKAAATRALEIDPLLPQAHSALADSLALYDWNWTESERHFKKALELDPNIAYTHIAYGLAYLTAMGKADEVVAELQRGVELEPLAMLNNSVLTSAYVYDRKYEKALVQARSTYDLDPNFGLARVWLGFALIANGKYDEAISAIGQASPDSAFGWMSTVVLAHAYAKQGKRAEAEQQISTLHDLAKTRYIRTYYLAAIYAALGDKDKAFAELEQSFAARDCFLGRIAIDPAMDPLRDDPRFKALLKKMNLPE